MPAWDWLPGCLPDWLTGYRLLGWLFVLARNAACASTHAAHTHAPLEIQSNSRGAHPQPRTRLLLVSLQLRPTEGTAGTKAAAAEQYCWPLQSGMKGIVYPVGGHSRSSRTAGSPFDPRNNSALERSNVSVECCCPPETRPATSLVARRTNLNVGHAKISLDLLECQPSVTTCTASASSLVGGASLSWRIFARVILFHEQLRELHKRAEQKAESRTPCCCCCCCRRFSLA